MTPSGEVQRDERKGKPAMNCRKSHRWGQYQECWLSWDKREQRPEAQLRRRPARMRREPDQALAGDGRTCRSDIKGGDRAGAPCKIASTDAGRSRMARTRGEGAVMTLDQRVPPLARPSEGVQRRHPCRPLFRLERAVRWQPDYIGWLLGACPSKFCDAYAISSLVRTPAVTAPRPSLKSAAKTTR